MNHRSFATGVVLGAILVGVAFFAGPVALQNGSMPGLAEGDRVYTGENVAFVTSDSNTNPLEGRLMVHVDGEWRDVQFEVRMMPAN